MKTKNPLHAPLVLTRCFLRHAALCAWLFTPSLSSVGEAAPSLVGEWGRPEALVFQGNRAYPRSRILAGLSRTMEYYLAAHPAAPLAEYTRFLERALQAGYERGGFPEVRVVVTPHSDTQQLFVQVTEGPGYRCGDVKVTGRTSLDPELVLRRVTEAVSGVADSTLDLTQPAGGSASRVRVAYGPDLGSGMVLWIPEAPAMMDEPARQALEERATGALTELDLCEPEVEVRVVPEVQETLSKELLVRQKKWAMDRWLDALRSQALVWEP